jgi:AcrR family transcriptional regulator
MNKVIVAPNHQVSAEKDLGPKARTVLQAARTVFLTHGFAGATTDMIQREAGVSKSTVYAHFANKETLFSEVVKAECLSSANNIRSIQFIPGQTARLLQDVAEAYLDIVVSKSGASLARIVIAEVERFPSLGKTFYEAGPRPSSLLVAELLALAQEAGDIALGDLTPDEAARVFTGAVRSEPQLHYLTHPNDQPTKTQKTQWAKLVVDTFMRAYGK